MPILATGTGHRTDPRRAKDHGFTLVEILVVVFIIALMTSVVVVSLPDGKSSAATGADDLQRELQRAGREAIVSGHPIALSVSGSTYRFERYQRGDWLPVSSPISAAPNAREPIVLEVLREDDASKAASNDASETVFERKLVFSPVGDVTPATLILSGNRERVGLYVSADGSVRRFDPTRQRAE